MKSPSHETVAQRAYQIWQDSGGSDGRDVENWFQAERELAQESEDKSTDANATSATPDRPKSETTAESVGEHHVSPVGPDEEASRAARQKKEARAPIAPHTNAPKMKPPETGKPLWSKPHSS